MIAAKMRHQLERDHRERVFDGGEFTLKGGWRGRLVGDVQRACWPIPSILRMQIQVPTRAAACVFLTVDGGLTVNPGETVTLHREGDRWISDQKATP